MTDREIMLHRFRNVHASVGQLAKSLGMDREEYADACKRAMEREAERFEKCDGRAEIQENEIRCVEEHSLEQKHDDISLDTERMLEKKTLEIIRKLVENLGEDSYIGAAFEGCFELAEENIENGVKRSIKQILEAKEKESE